MPDITMCEGNECPIRDTCKRFTATPSGRQAYFVETPYDDGCKYYSPTQPDYAKE